MTTVLLDRPVEASRAPNGGAPARRAVVRWGFRLFRREWRQQLLILVLLGVAVAATVAGLAVVVNAAPPPRTTFHLPGSDTQLSADVASLEGRFGVADVYAHQQVKIPGTLLTLDLRSPLDGTTLDALRVVAGRFPDQPGEVALTRGVAGLLDLQVGSTWSQGGQDLRVVGLVEDPRDLNDAFAVGPAGQLAKADDVTVRFYEDLSRSSISGHQLPSGSPLAIDAESPASRTAAAVAVLALATLSLLFVGLVAVAGFSVVARRRQRALGLLGSLGATDGHLRLVLLANGAAVGATAAVVGAVIGLAGWLAFAPHLEGSAGHRIDRFDVPWWAIGAAMLLAIATAVAASWWPARAAAKTSTVSALSGRPPLPRPAGRFALLGAGLLGVGMASLALADQNQPLLIVVGIIASVVGVLLFAPLAIRAIAAAGGRAPVAVRLALRDLARYQARSGAALGAATLAIGIAAIVSVSAASHIATEIDSGSNLGADELLLHLSPLIGPGGPSADVTPAQIDQARAAADSLATSLGAKSTVELEQAVNPNAPLVKGPDGAGGHEPAGLVQVTPQGNGGSSIELRVPLYVATPELLAHFGISPSQIRQDTDIVSSSTGLAGLQLAYGPRLEVGHPVIQRLPLPKGSSEPNTLITTGAMARLGLEPVTSGWLLQAPHALTAQQIATARKAAAAAGLAIETRTSTSSLEQLAHEATAAGILLALGVLALTIGLIRSEAANDLRVLTAAGATGSTRRLLSASTSGALALLAGLLGTGMAYLALAAFYRSDLSTLDHPPVTDLVLLVVGLPLAAFVAGWLLAGREPRAIARRPLD